MMVDPEGRRLGRSAPPYSASVCAGEFYRTVSDVGAGILGLRPIDGMLCQVHVLERRVSGRSNVLLKTDQARHV